MALVQVTSTTTTVPLKTALLVGVVTTILALIGRWWMQRSQTAGSSISLPMNVDQALTVDMKGKSRLVLSLPSADNSPTASSPVSQWVSVTLDGKLVDIPPVASVSGLWLQLTKPAGVIVATHRDPGGSSVLRGSGLDNTVTTINYANAGYFTGAPAQSTSGAARSRAWNSALHLIRN